MVTPLLEGVTTDEILKAEKIDNDSPDIPTDDCSFILAITQVLKLFNPTFQLRRWQENALETIQEGLEGGQIAFLVEAKVGTGKTNVALGTALGLICRATPYKAKVLFLSPLVALAMEQYAYLKQVAKAQSKLMSSRKIKAAYRVKMDTSTNLRSAQWITATYEHGRNILADGYVQIYPGSHKLNRRLHQSIRLVVVDEIHHLASDRGHVVSSILGLCLHFGIPVLMMTGTPHELIRKALREVYEEKLTTIVNKDESLCHQLAIRIDDDATLYEMIVQSLLENMKNGWLRQGWLIFARTIRKVYPLFLKLFTTLRDRCESLTNRNPYLIERLESYYEALTGSIPEEFQITRSGIYPRKSEKKWEKQLANERRTAWAALHLGIAYNWRDLGDIYISEVLKRLVSGKVLAIVTTTTLATGVNVDGIEHIAIWNDPVNSSLLSTKQSFSSHELAQMIGRCGRWSPGFALLRGINPPTAEEIISSLPPLPHDSEANIFTWLILRMSRGYHLKGFDNEGRIVLKASQWIDMMCLMPTTISITNRFNQSNYEELMKKLTETTHLCDIDGEGLITTTAHPSTLRICQNDSSMAILLCHIVEGYVRFFTKSIFPSDEINQGYRFNIDPACPLLAAFVYWTSRHTSLPTIYWNPPKFNIRCHAEMLIGLPKHFPTIGINLNALTICLQGVLSQESTFGTPLASMPSWEKDKIITLSIATAYAAMGCLTNWYEYVPREDLGKILEELPLYEDCALHTLGLRWKQSNRVYTHVRMAKNVVDAASDMITAHVHGNIRNEYANISPNPLICSLSISQSVRPFSYEINEANAELQSIGFIVNDWTPVLACTQKDLTRRYPFIGKNAWIDSVMGPSVTKGGEIIVQAADYDSS
jgi:hypothetical protein